MDRVFQDAKDKYVSAVVVYGKTADKKLYVDAAYTTQVAKADAEDAFTKGVLLIKDGTTLLKPVAMAGTKVTTVVVASAAVAGTEWTVAAD